MCQVLAHSFLSIWFVKQTSLYVTRCCYLIFIAMKKRLLMVVMALSCLTFVDARSVVRRKRQSKKVMNKI